MRRDLAALRAEKRKEAEAKEKAALGLSISPEMAKSTIPEAVAPKMEKQESADGINPFLSEKETSPEPIPTTEAPDVPPSPKTKPEDITDADDGSANDVNSFDIDDLFGDPGDGENEHENTVNSIDMAGFPSHDDGPLLSGLTDYANMPDTSLPESTGPGDAPTSSAMENDNGGLDFSMLGIPGSGTSNDLSAPNTFGLDGANDEGATDDSQRPKDQQDPDDFWAVLHTGDDTGFGDDGGMGEADNSFADLIRFDELDGGGGDEGGEIFDWMK
jgi:hypothetical protein